MLPDRPKSGRAAVVVCSDVVKIYANRDMLRWLSKCMEKLSESPTDEYYELHMEPNDRRVVVRDVVKGYIRGKDVFVLADKNIAASITRSDASALGFHPNFMAVEEPDIDRLAKHVEAGVIDFYSDDWKDSGD